MGPLSRILSCVASFRLTRKHSRSGAFSNLFLCVPDAERNAVTFGAKRAKTNQLNWRNMATLLTAVTRPRRKIPTGMRCGIILTESQRPMVSDQATNDNRSPTHSPPKVHESSPRPSVRTYHWHNGRVTNLLGRSFEALKSQGKRAASPPRLQYRPIVIAVHALAPDQGCHSGAEIKKIIPNNATPRAARLQADAFVRTVRWGRYRAL